MMTGLLKDEELVLSLIRNDCERNGTCVEQRLVKLGTLMNIHAERVQKIKENLIEQGKLEMKGNTIYLV